MLYVFDALFVSSPLRTLIGPLGPSVFWLICVTVHADCLLVCWLVSLLFCFLQGAATFSALAGPFMDPELSRLASCLASRCSRAFDKFRLWAASYNKISVLPSNYLSVAIYLEFLLQSNSSYSALEAAL